MIDAEIDAADPDDPIFHRRWRDGFIYGKMAAVDQAIAKYFEATGGRPARNVIEIWGPFLPKRIKSTVTKVDPEGNEYQSVVYAQRRSKLTGLKRTDAIYFYNVHSHEGMRLLRRMNNQSWADVYDRRGLKQIAELFPDHVLGSNIPHISRKGGTRKRA